VQACGRHVVSVPLLESAAAGLIAARQGTRWPRCRRPSRCRGPVRRC
jgi:hypothetical protein